MKQNWSNQDILLNPNIQNIEDLEKPIIINLSKIAENYVKQINEQINENVDNIVLKNLSTEYLKKLKKEINEELKSRRKVRL